MKVKITFYRYHDKYFVSHLDKEITLLCDEGSIIYCIRDFMITEILRTEEWNNEHSPSTLNLLKLINDTRYIYDFKFLISKYMKGECVALKIDFKIDPDEDIMVYKPDDKLFDNMVNKINKYDFTHHLPKTDI